MHGAVARDQSIVDFKRESRFNETDVPGPSDHPCHTLRRHFFSRADQITFILPTLIIHDHHKLAPGYRRNGIGDRIEREW